MEAMACGTPCVGFSVGGIPEMIDHKENGYVARYKDARDLADGIRYVISEENHARLSQAAREKVMRCYSEEAVAKRYIAEYSEQSEYSE
jgi:glycosyltransferase involved in cell wall biosynthesis